MIRNIFVPIKAHLIDSTCCSSCLFRDENNYYRCDAISHEDCKDCGGCPPPIYQCGLTNEVIQGKEHLYEDCWIELFRSQACIDEVKQFGGRLVPIDCGDAYCEKCRFLGDSTHYNFGNDILHFKCMLFEDYQNIENDNSCRVNECLKNERR